MVRPCTKSVLVRRQPNCCLVCVGPCEWLKCLSIFLVPFQNSSTPLYPRSVASQGTCPTSYSFVIFILDSHLSLWRRLGVHQRWFNIGKSYTPYKFIQDFLNDSNRDGCYFKKYYYYYIWIIHVQSPTNLPKSMWKLLFNVVDVIFYIRSPKRKTHKVHRNNAPSKTFKKYAFGTKKLKNKQKLQLIWTYENMVKV
jgi:hypothetical protein